MLSHRKYDAQDVSSTTSAASINRRNSLHSHSQQLTKLSNKQAIGMFRILDRYTNPTYSHDIQLSPNLRSRDTKLNHHSKQKPHINKLNLAQMGTMNQYSMNPFNSQDLRIQSQLEKEIYNLRADLNRLKAIESEQNRKYQDKLVNMIQENQRYPPPNVLFGNNASQQIQQPMFFF